MHVNRPQMIAQLVDLFWLQALGVAALLLLLYVFRRPAAAKTFVPVGAALLAISARRTDLKQKGVELPDWVFFIAFLLGVCFVLVGLIGMVVPFTVIKEWASSLVEAPRFKCRLARRNELEQLHQFAEEFFGDSIASVESMRQWHRKNPQLFYLVHESTVRGGKTTDLLVGFFDLIPLTKRAVELLEKEELNGATFSEHHIVKPNGQPAAVYVAAIATRSFSAKHWILGKVEERLDRYLRRGLTIYGRPVTQTGLRLVKKHDFVPVSPQARGTELLRIYKLEPKADQADRRPVRRRARRHSAHRHW